MTRRSNCRDRSLVLIIFVVVVLGINWSSECSDRALANPNIFTDPNLDALVG